MAVEVTEQPRLRGPRVDFRELQARNRRRSLILAACLVLVMAALGAALGATLGSWLVGIGGGIGFALIQYLIARQAGAKMVMAASRARPLERRDDPQLVNVVEEIAIAGGMPCPQIYVIQDESPNAFATGFKPGDAAVAITTGLRNKLRRDELQAVMAHEVAHIRNGDSGYMVLMAVIVGSIALLADIGLRSLWYGGRMRGGGKGKGKGAILLLVLVAVLAILAPVFSRLLQAAVSRQREYLADATSVELTRDPSALASALEKLTSDPTSLKVANRATQHLFIVNPMRRARGGGGAFSTHPPLRERVRRIRALFC
jgi:heat shock protein HtpX